MNALASRKFLFALFCASNVFALCWGHRMSGGETVTVVSILAALYKAANVYEKQKLGEKP
jgi:hypothetical protein